MCTDGTPGYFDTCGGAPWGFSFTDTTGATPGKITVEFDVGIPCSTNSDIRTILLNGVTTGTFTLQVPASQCACTVPTGVGNTIVIDTGLAAYNPNASNSITFTGASSCEGFRVKSTSGVDGTIAVVTLSQPTHERPFPRQ